MIEIFLFLVVFYGLFSIGFTYNNILNKKLYIGINEILIGFILFAISGTIFSFLTSNILDNSESWKISFGLLIIFSIIFIIKNSSYILFFKRFLTTNNLIFSMIFIFVAVLRMSNSDILHTEKIMEFMMFSSTMSSSSIISEDLWFYNNSISYYSFGYFIYSSIPSIFNLDSAYAYNLVLPSVISLTYLSLINLLEFVSHIKKSIIFLILFIYMIFLGPLATIVELVNHLGLGSDYFYKFIDIEGITKKESIELFWPNDNWWWFSISRIISFNKPDIFYSDYTINEFPSFSIILGDIHPHILVLPFVILCFSFIFFLFKNQSFNRINIFWINITFIFSVLINPWYSVVILWYLFSNIIFLYKTFDKKEKKIIINIIIILIIELILFVILFNPGNQLVFPYISNVKIISRFHHLFLYWGFSFLTISISISYIIYKNKIYFELLRYFLVTLAILLSIPLFFSDIYLNLELFINLLLNNFFFAFLISASIILIKNSQIEKSILILLFSSLITIVGSEYIYVVDHFNNRMNTVFKFYFINYLILNLISLYFIFLFINSFTISKRLILVSLIFILFIPSLWWSVSAIKTRSSDNIGSFGLNGLDYLSEDDIEAIQFIKNNTNKNDIVLEGVGKSYTKSNILSSYTGRSTLLGWVNHQLQWRSETSEIIALDNAIEEFYKNPQTSNLILNKYKVEYIVLSTYEKKRYDLNNDDQFRSFELIFENDYYKIFKVND